MFDPIHPPSPPLPQSGKKVFKLPDLWIRPTLGGKGRKLPGTLEAHANGFRYSNPKNEVR